MFPKISKQDEVVYLNIQQSSDTLEGVQRFRFGKGTMSSGEVKPVRSGGTITMVLSHSNIGIDVGIGGYQIR